MSSQGRCVYGVLNGQEAEAEDLRAVGLILRSAAQTLSLGWRVGRNQNAQLFPAHCFLFQECIALRAPGRNAMYCFNSPAVILPMSEP